METRNAEQVRIGLALLAIRIAGGTVFFYHGSGKLFGLFGGSGLAAFGQMAHLPPAVAFLVALAEFCGGVSLLTGVLTRLGAAAIMPVMLGAIFLVHGKNGFSLQQQGYEYAFTLQLMAIALLITGAGPYSLIRFLPDKFNPAGSRSAAKAD
jgi:putative oxidoreductase